MSAAINWLDEASAHKFCLVDPTLIAVSDISNLAVAVAYVLGFPFMAVLFFRVVERGVWPPIFRLIFWLGVGFVYFCGVSHFLDVIVTHFASYRIYQAVIAELAVTAIVSLAFVGVGIYASRSYELHVSITRKAGRE